ncbi:hypothetical protein LGV61_13005 [Desulfurispirillum indicum]|uniref:hypothetical protein n=1 Tax=Desulfurispirillum indicum TaxID=936456 RepID=UPI001CFB8C7A|nr:hypothetical protein [Desulfurispirillum indicum]UCZ56630.1 hypothetical protein LGV61_13005 [Desulfurispirillum indicum]
MNKASIVFPLAFLATIPSDDAVLNAVRHLLIGTERVGRDHLAVIFCRHGHGQTVHKILGRLSGAFPVIVYVGEPPPDAELPVCASSGGLVCIPDDPACVAETAQIFQDMAREGKFVLNIQEFRNRMAEYGPYLRTTTVSGLAHDLTALIKQAFTPADSSDFLEDQPIFLAITQGVNTDLMCIEFIRIVNFLLDIAKERPAMQMNATWDDLLEPGYIRLSIVVVSAQSTPCRETRRPENGALLFC